MLLSIKSIAALSIVPLSFAKHHFEKAEQADFCNLVGEVNRLDFINTLTTESQVADTVQYSLTPFSSYCPTIDGQVGTPVCRTTEGSGEPPSSLLLAQNTACRSNFGIANQLVSDPSVYRCVTYYAFPGAAPFPCTAGVPLCRYCALQDYAPDLSRNLLYAPNHLVGASPGTLLTYNVTPFYCGAPKCPSFAAVPTLPGPITPTKYVRLSASYCVASSANVPPVTSDYAGLVQNFACSVVVSPPLIQLAINQTWGCYIETNLTAFYPGSTPGTWCDPGYVPLCFYDVSKPYSYPPLAA